jgi:hypothetical protein
MPFAVQPFIGALIGDGSRPNLFDIIFPELGALFTLRCQAASVPSSTMGVASTYYFGREVKLAGNRRFDPWQVEVIMDEEDYAVGPRAALERWSDKLNSHQLNIRNPSALPPITYMQDATVIHYSKAGFPIATYNMVMAWPVEVGPIGLSWGANDTIETYQVVFAYQYWTSINTT